jgi:acylphosphatase
VRVARQYIIGGRVQGVGFRYFSQATAVREGIVGWVTNRSDGCVEVWAEGERDALDRFEARLRHGPSGARVERFDSMESQPAGRDGGFTIT